MGIQSICVGTKRREEMVDITNLVRACVLESGISEGTCLIYCPHTTSGIAINENADPDVTRDILAGLAKIAPLSGGYAHSEGNSDAHIKACLVGSSQQVIIHQGKLLLGTWQGIYFCEFDGPRSRQVHVRCSA